MSFISNIIGKLSALSKTQKIITAAVTAITLAVAGGGAVLVSTGSNNYNEMGTESTQISENGTEIFGTEVTEVVGEMTVHMEMVSIEKDLKIKVVDEDGNLVKGVPFEFDVAQLSVIDEDDEESAKETKTEAVTEDIDMEEYEHENYVDDDEDGIVHILNLKGGEFLIQVKEVEGYIFEADTIKTWVKEKIEYKKVDVENEVKKESQVNSAIEDTAQNNVVVESVVVDTLPLIASTTTASEIAREQVDTSNFPKASSGVESPFTLSTEITRVCTVHNEEITKENVIEADCTTDGSYTNVVTCSRCKTEIRREVIEEPAKGHTESAPVIENKVEPQVGIAGSQDKVVYCAVCNVEISRVTEPLAALEADATVPEADTTVPNANTTAPTESTEPSSQQAEENLDVTARKHMGNVIVATASEQTMNNTIELYAAVGSGTYTETLSATVVLPFDIRLYSWNAEQSQAVLSLKITDEAGIIDKDNIAYAVNHTAIISCERDSSDPTKANIKAKGAGTANVQITVPVWTDEAKTNKKYETLSCTIMVDDYSADAGTQLKDKDGNLLYTDASCTKPATAADYANPSVKLYGQPKYTGWQTLNGSLYYYKEDHTPATGNQTIGGVQYVFSADGVLQTGNQSLGIDVSKWQGSIDWTAVANSGVKFAIIRCAYRGAATGVIVEDPYFRANIQGATANGIKVGVYFFTQAINEYEAVEEASTAIGLVAGYHLNYPIFIDTENASNGRANGLDVATRTSVVKAFCETVRNAGYKPGIYASRSWYNTKLDMSQLSTYNIWVAQYNTTCTYTGRYDIWQYTSSGSIPGINGRVDLNIGYTNY